MKLKYSLNERDYLKWLLYDASKSKSIKNVRLKSWFYFSFFFVLIISLLYLAEYKILMYYSILGSLIILFLYPIIQRDSIEKSIKKNIEEKIRNSFGKEINLEFLNEQIEVSESIGEAKLNYSSIEKIIETANHFFLKFEDAGAVIIPKKWENVAEVKLKLEELSEMKSINYLKELDWEWK